MSAAAIEMWMKTTARIAIQGKGAGSGFFVAREVSNNGHQVFLVTNKHVLAPAWTQRSPNQVVQVMVNKVDVNGKVSGLSVEVDLDGRYKEHPDKDVDIAAVRITELWVRFNDLNNKAVVYSDFVASASLKELAISAGDEVLVIGFPGLYPNGWRHVDSNWPLVRQGMISTRIGEQIEDQKKTTSGVRTRRLRAFLFDGATIPGSSGSPVILKPVIGRQAGGNILLGAAPPLLLGVVSETRFAPVAADNGQTLSFAGMGLAVDADCVRETVELFYE